MKKPPRKPTGITGPTLVSRSGAEFQRLEFPPSKEEVETLVASGFISESIPGGLKIERLAQNKQNDFDFQISTNIGDMYLELMEVAPLGSIRGSYSAAPHSYNPYFLALEVLQHVMSKSQRYAAVKDKPILLLLYVTHWAFVLSETVIALLQYWLAHLPHSFGLVYVYHPIDARSGIRHLLYPTPKEHWKGFDPESYRESFVHNFSPLPSEPPPDAA